MYSLLKIQCILNSLEQRSAMQHFLEVGQNYTAWAQGELVLRPSHYLHHFFPLLLLCCPAAAWHRQSLPLLKLPATKAPILQDRSNGSTESACGHRLPPPDQASRRQEVWSPFWYYVVVDLEIANLGQNVLTTSTWVTGLTQIRDEGD